jgi:hypothetical protein
MSRPIAYNASGPLSGSIRGGSVNYTVDSGNRDYTTFASKKWVPSADGVAPIVFVTDSYTQGITNQATAVPLFYSCNGTGSAAIIYTANRVPSSPGNYTDANVALNDLITARGYFILESNDPYQGDYQSGNLLDIDASKMSSYPQTGTNWYDLSGNDFDFSLVNGPSFQSGGWFNIDGTDDAIILTGNSTLKSTNTLVVWLRTTDTTGLLLTGEPLNSTGPYYVAAYYPGQGFYSGAAGSPDYFMNTLATVNPATPINYLDGRFYMWEVKGLNFSGWTTTWNFFNYQAGFQIAGDVAKIQMFNSYLTAAQSKQLYFGSPIVTDGLVFAVDANNIVSYPKSGTAWYNLTGSNIGTLINGPTFNQENGGSIKFDGTDDYVNVPSATNLDLTSQGTVSTWINPATVTQGLFTGLVARNTGGSVNQQSYQLSWRQVSGGLYGAICDGSGTYNEVLASFPSIANAWYNIVFTWNGSLVSMYTNGVLSAQTTQTINNQVLNTDLTIGGYTYKGAGGSGEPFNGKISNVKLYNRGLTAAEIQQNYQAEQYRFEGPAGPVTNGLLLYWDAGNLDSYPGTGTTIYDLSGNGNNGNVVNGVGFNQTNGGVLTFDGVDDLVYSNTPNLSGTNNTVMGAARYTGTSPHGRMINANINNWLIGCWNNSTENYYAVGWVSPVQNGANDTNWRIVTALGDVGADSYTSYINNVLNAGPNNAGSEGPNGISVGAQTAGGYSEPSKGEFSFVLVYNRVLTAAEMTQNYNYFKGRFGL